MLLEVTTAAGKLSGVREGGITVYKGVPYAQPPVGSLRWKPPRPMQAWEGTRSADAFGPSCHSFLVWQDNTHASEDCLYLNIWTPAKTPDAGLPVMFYIHEGGFVFGSGRDDYHSGHVLAERQDVVVVQFNYRLGPFGFLALDELDREEGTPSGNFGLQDQHAALRWVHENIAAFGGDANNVTVFGESAGSHSVAFMLASPLSKGLFHKAILQSGGWWDRISGAIRSFESVRDQGKGLLARMGVGSLEELRDVPAEALVKAHPFDFSQDPGYCNYGPGIDNYVLPAHGREAPKIPLLAGYTADEGLLFVKMLPSRQTQADLENWGRILAGPGRLEEFLSFYPSVPESARKESVARLAGDLTMVYTTWRAAAAQAEAGVDDVYHYVFSYTSEYSPQPLHTADINFVFGTVDVPPFYGPPPKPASQADRDFSDALMSYWGNFARFGNPNGRGSGGGLPVWPKYRGGKDGLMELGNEIKVTEAPVERLRFVESWWKEGNLPEEWRRLVLEDS